MITNTRTTGYYQRCNSLLTAVLGALLVLFSNTSIATTDEQSAREGSKPNIVILYTDDMGWGDLGVFGHPYIRTPSIDRLAKEGQQWTDFYVPSPVCSPSRAALLTGRHPVRTGLYGVGTPVMFPGDTRGIPHAEVTLAEALKATGYRTGILGKWHLGDAPEFFPTRHGFDYWFGIPYSNDMQFVRRPGVEDLFKLQKAGKSSELMAIFSDFLKSFEAPDYNDFNVPLWRSECTKHGCTDELLEQPTVQPTLTARLTKEAVRFIAKQADQPFFLYLPYTMPHLPIFADEAFQGKSLAGPYGDTIEEIDWSVGEIIKALETAGLDDNTLVFFSSDNGPWQSASTQFSGSAGPFKGSKQEVYEGGVRVPTVFWWPGKVTPKITSELGSVLDLYPTIATITGIDASTADDGFDLTDSLFTGGASPRNEVALYRKGELRAYRKGDYKLHLFDRAQGGSPLETPQLYNLKRDVAERENIAVKHPEIVADLQQAVRIHRSAMIRKPPLFDQRFLDLSNDE
ncbi:sulfatase [Luminiphilus sp.]|nr:sulfatase [Luminiphilus sp.]